MAKSSVTTTQNYGGRKATLTIEETSYSIVDNTSTITWTLEVLGGSVNYYDAYDLTAYVNGQTVYGPTTKSYSSQTFPAAKGTKTGTLTITHNADGTASAVPFSIRGSFYYNNPTTVAGTALSLTTIPRASSVSTDSSSLTTNSTYTITVTPAAENTFSHVLKYSIGSANGTIASLNTSTTTYSWSVPRSLAAQIPNSTESSSGALVITCETYNGSSLVGSKSCYCKLIADSGIIPTLSSSSIQDGNSTVRGKNWNVYLQNMSYVNINSMSGSGSQGSTIASYWCTFEGTNYSSTSLSGLNSQIQARGLPTTGDRTLQLWVVDSRGRLSVKSSKSYTVIAYSSPSINSYDAYRSNSSGTATDDGTYFRYTLNCSISSCNSKNPFTVNIRWKVKGSSTDTGSSKIKNAITTESSYNSGGTLGGGNIGTNNTYEIIFEVSDAFSTITRSKDIGPAFELLHYHANGKAVAFGKKSSAGSNEELFEVQMPAKLNELGANRYYNRNHDEAPWYMNKYIIDLTSYNVNTYYPVVSSNVIPRGGLHRIIESTLLTGDSKPSWCTHNSGFTSQIDILQLYPGWGTTNARTIILDESYSFADAKPGWYEILTNSSKPCFYLRGGGKYRIFTDFKVDNWTIHTSSYSYNDQTVAPTTSARNTYGRNLNKLDNTYLTASNLLTYVYPVGSIYMSTVNTSPASFLGGTWEQLKNAFLYAGTSYGSGNGTGTSTNNHTLTIDQIPSHNHEQSWAGNDHTTNNLVTDKTTGSHSDRNVFGTGSGCRYNSQSAWHGSGATIIGTGFRGGSQGHSHAIPYISVFVWRRTA